MKRLFVFLSFLLVVAGAAAQDFNIHDVTVPYGPVPYSPTVHAPVLTLDWSRTEVAPGKFEERMVFTNVSREALGAGWMIGMIHGGRSVEQPEDAVAKFTYVNGQVWKIEPTEYYKTVPVGGTFEVVFPASAAAARNFDAPEGVYIALADGDPVSIPVCAPIVAAPNNGRTEYERNADAGPYTMGQNDILPGLKSAVAQAGETIISSHINIVAGPFTNEADYLAEKLVARGALRSDRRGATVVRFVEYPAVSQPEGYRLNIAEGQVVIAASTAAGAFYGAQTLLDLLKGRSLPTTMGNVAITDWPDMGYRGQHFDTSRNYTGKERVMELIDILASYKLNVLHLHFSDDDGWRIEIPGLPELTEIGARRGHTFTETDVMQPSYSGGPDADTAIGSGHLSRQDFIDVLRYAKRRHVWVIPEIESPGHARAARVAMYARYLKYKDTDMAKAEEFLLDDLEDKSEYVSVQDFNDNVMNVAVPGTYRFMEKVIDELIAMYRDADARLEVIHVGGDEVPRGVWTASPAAERFMRENGIDGVVELADYYVLRVNDILKARGLKIAGWQELVEGRSEKFRAAVKDNVAFVNAWSTNGRNAQTPYRLVNQGYPVVLSNVGNFYMDMAYVRHPDENGLFWGGFVTEQRAFSAQPYNLYASMWRDDNGKLVDNSRAGEGLVMPTEEGKGLILGVQGQLWSETIREWDQVTYYLLPKMMGMVDRGWNASPQWRSGADFLRDYSRFNAIITEREMPYWASQGFAFRIAPPGLYIENGMLYANTSIPGAEIRYTVDGSTPTKNSTLWTAPVKCSAGRVEAKVFYLGRESVVSAFEN